MTPRDTVAGDASVRSYPGRDRDKLAREACSTGAGAGAGAAQGSWGLLRNMNEALCISIFDESHAPRRAELT
jgi:hypothetical protein